MKERIKNTKGITLIALIVTIIILLILAGVTINVALGDNGLFKKSQEAVKKYSEAQYKEELEMISAEVLLDMNTNTGKTYAELYQEKINERLGDNNSIFAGAEVEKSEEISGLLKVTTKDGNIFWIEEGGIKQTEEDANPKRAGDITIFPKEDYGKVVTGYNSKTSGITWRLWYVDNPSTTDKSQDTVYLIGDFIEAAQAPTKTVSGTTYSVLEGKNNKCLKFGSDTTTGIMPAYTNSSKWVWDNQNAIASKWLSQWYGYGSHKTTGDNNNMKSVAYMMDSSIWTSKFGDTNNKANYVLGGPTTEMFCASYKDSHPKKYLESRVNGDTGYEVAWNENGTVGSYAAYQTGVDTTGNNKIYAPGSSSYPSAMWLAAPSSSDPNTANTMMLAYYYSNVSASSYNNTRIGFCPVVSLKSGVPIEPSSDGFRIK